MNSSVRTFLLAACLLPLVQGGARAEEDLRPAVELTARPGLCVLKDPATRECVMGVELAWRAPEGDYCLYQSESPGPLRCWETHAAGQHTAALAAAKDVTYTLQQREPQQDVAQVLVRVVSLAQRKPERRRRRHAWTPM